MCRLVDASRQLILTADDPEYMESGGGEVVEYGEGSGGSHGAPLH